MIPSEWMAGGVPAQELAGTIVWTEGRQPPSAAATDDSTRSISRAQPANRRRPSRSGFARGRRWRPPSIRRQSRMDSDPAPRFIAGRGQDLSVSEMPSSVASTKRLYGIRGDFQSQEAANRASRIQRKSLSESSNDREDREGSVRQDIVAGGRAADLNGTRRAWGDGDRSRSRVATRSGHIASSAGTRRLVAWRARDGPSDRTDSSVDPAGRTSWKNTLEM